MPMRSEAQRRLMYAAASKKGGADGVSQKVAKEFTSADQGGKLPERKTMSREPKRWTPKKKADVKPADKSEEKKPGAEDRHSKLYTRKKD